MPKLRQNPITGEWVVIVPERAKRPEDFVEIKKEPLEEKDCPFCENGAARETVIKDAGTANVLVIPNKYPSFTDCGERVIDEGDNLYFETPSRGAHEVIIFDKHDLKLEEMSPEQIEEILTVYKKRIEWHGNNPEISHTMVIHNWGVAAGASLGHPHSQLMGSSVVPSYIEKELTGSKKYFEENGRCVFCEMINREREKAVRVLDENDNFIAFCAFAARFPFEMWIVPKRHQSDYAKISADEIRDLAKILKMALGKLAAKLKGPDYNFWIHSIPYRLEEAADYYHWHVEIAPQLSKFGGYEYGAGTVIDVVSPEAAARFLKS